MKAQTTVACSHRLLSSNYQTTTSSSSSSSSSSFPTILRTVYTIIKLLHTTYIILQLSRCTDTAQLF